MLCHTKQSEKTVFSLVCVYVCENKAQGAEPLSSGSGSDSWGSQLLDSIPAVSILQPCSYIACLPLRDGCVDQLAHESSQEPMVHFSGGGNMEGCRETLLAGGALACVE